MSNEKKEKIGLFIGRFQPFHNGHLDAIHSMFKEIDFLKIGVGSAQYGYLRENPFTLDERIAMIQRSLQKQQITKYRIYGIEDIHDYSQWAEHVQSIVGHFDVVYTGNNIVRDLFTKKAIDVRELKENVYISSTEIRRMMFQEAPWQPYVPPGTLEVLTESDGVKRITEVFTDYKSPSPTVDIILEYDGDIVLVERRHPPYGWAIPGGFIEYGEDAEAAVKREAKEETNLDVEIIRQLHTYTNPKRDPRGHVIAIAYHVKGHGFLKAGDDAKKARAFTREEIPDQMPFDHKQILEDFFNKRY